MSVATDYFDEILRASDVSDRDGIGMEFYKDGQLIIEIFRDDTLRTRTVSNYKKDLPLEVLEDCIKIFKERIDWDYI